MTIGAGSIGRVRFKGPVCSSVATAPTKLDQSSALGGEGEAPKS